MTPNKRVREYDVDYYDRLGNTHTSRVCSYSAEDAITQVALQLKAHTYYCSDRHRTVPYYSEPCAVRPVTEETQ